MSNSKPTYSIPAPMGFSERWELIGWATIVGYIIWTLVVLSAW